MTTNFVTRLGAALVLSIAAPAAATEWRGSVGDWDLRADRFDDGGLYCYAGADRGPGDRLTFVRSEVGLTLVLTRRSWRLRGEDVVVDVAVDDRWRDRRRAAVDRRTLVLSWREPAGVRTALARGRELRVTGQAPGGDVRWSLAGGAAALAALEGCWRDGPGAPAVDAPLAGAPSAAEPAPPAPSSAGGTDRAALAARFETWLERAAPRYRAAVTPVPGEPGRYRLATTLGDGEIRLLAGATPAAVVARGTAALRATCADARVTTDRGRQALEGGWSRRTRLACAGAEPRHLEALVVGYPADGGGLLVVVPDPSGSGLGAGLTAALAEDIAAAAGFPLAPRPAERAS